jgi:hypothetical protein
VVDASREDAITAELVALVRQVYFTIVITFANYFKPNAASLTHPAPAARQDAAIIDISKPNFAITSVTHPVMRENDGKHPVQPSIPATAVPVENIVPPKSRVSLPRPLVLFTKYDAFRLKILLFVIILHLLQWH